VDWRVSAEVSANGVSRCVVALAVFGVEGGGVAATTYGLCPYLNFVNTKTIRDSRIGIHVVHHFNRGRAKQYSGFKERLGSVSCEGVKTVLGHLKTKVKLKQSGV